MYSQDTGTLIKKDLGERFRLYFDFNILFKSTQFNSIQCDLIYEANLKLLHPFI